MFPSGMNAGKDRTEEEVDYDHVKILDPAPDEYRLQRIKKQ